MEVKVNRVSPWEDSDVSKIKTKNPIRKLMRKYACLWRKGKRREVDKDWERERDPERQRNRNIINSESQGKRKGSLTNPWPGYVAFNVNDQKYYSCDTSVNKSLIWLKGNLMWYILLWIWQYPLHFPPHLKNFEVKEGDSALRVKV